MPDSTLQFGTSVGDIIDSETSELVTPKVTGEFTFQVKDPALFASRAQPMGGESAITGGVRAAVAAYLKEAIVGAANGGTPVKAIIGKMPELAAGVATRINAELAEIGAGIRLGSASLTLSPEDQGRLKAGAPGRPPSAGRGVAPSKGKGMPVGVLVGGLVGFVLLIMVIVHFVHSARSIEPPAEHERHGKH